MTAAITIYKTADDMWRYRVRVGDMSANSYKGYIVQADAKRYAEEEARLIAAQIKQSTTYEYEV